MPAKQIIIPITDHADQCSLYYLVEWKLTTASGYNQEKQFLTETENNIIIDDVLDNTEYDVRITRYCCNGGISAPLVLLVDTTTTSPVLSAPAAFTLDPTSPPVAGSMFADWTVAANADEYIVEVSDTSDFIVIVETATVNDPTSSATITGLTSGNTYYGRVKARAVGYVDSDWSNTDSGVCP